MSWVNELIDLYEINSDKIGVIEYRRDMPYVLLPPFHTTVTAQITVTIDQDGNFINAELVDLNELYRLQKNQEAVQQERNHILCVIISGILLETIQNIIKMMESVMNYIFPS